MPLQPFMANVYCSCFTVQQKFLADKISCEQLTHSENQTELDVIVILVH